jgi:SHS family sialic acid transporter-like MFS transporter
MTTSAVGRWLALSAAVLGWLFDGFEMGIFSVVGKDALGELLGPAQQGDSDPWFGIITALFLVGAAAGGVLFGWLGDRFGRVRAMSLSILTYALCTGGCGLAQSPLQMAGLRFLAALGMGGEWALGVALVMEVWPTGLRSFLPGVSVRAWLAGVIGASANLGFALVALLSIGLTNILGDLRSVLSGWQISGDLIEFLLRNNGWRLLMLLGITPALLTFVLRLFVPESAKWQREKEEGRTSHWAIQDLLGVAVGTLATVGVVALWIPGNQISWPVQLVGTVAGLLVTVVGYLYPVARYLARAGVIGTARRFLLRRMLLAALLSGIALLGTWGSIQWAPKWVAQTVAPNDPTAKGWTQFYSAMGAVFGTVVAAWMGDWMGRRKAYFLLCILALASTWGFYWLNSEFNWQFLLWVFVAGWFVGAFYGWIPLYFPELFPTAVRAIGQGFGYNFGRILAAVGTVQTGVLVQTVFQNRIETACGVMACIYFLGMIVIWFAPETSNQALPE